MSLGTCKIPADRTDTVSQSVAAAPGVEPSSLRKRLGRICNYVIHRPALWIPILLLTTATVIFWITDADLALSRQFYVSGGSEMDAGPDESPGSETGSSAPPKSDLHWPARNAEPWKSFYSLGVYPAWVLGLGGLAVFLISFVWTKLESWRDAGLFLVLMLALGPGLLINGIFKPYWGRPRPNDTTAFRGHNKFLPVGDMDFGGDGASFPSGHASMGFYLMAPAFVLYRRHRLAAAAFLALGLAGGLIMGAARIVAGSHFASDVVWSAGIVYFTGLALAAAFHFGRDKTRQQCAAE
jgi:lipid A 4'-phosphatase